MFSTTTLLFSAFALSLSELALSVFRQRGARQVLLLVFIIEAGLGAVLTLTLFGAPLGLAMLFHAIATYVACKIVAGIEGRSARMAAALVALGLLLAPFGGQIADTLKLAQKRTIYARLWAEAAQHPLEAELAGYRLSLPWSPQLRVHSLCAATDACTIAFLDASPEAHNLLRGGPPPALPGAVAQLATLHLISTEPSGRAATFGLSRLERPSQPSRADWCAAHLALQPGLWCVGALTRDVLLRPVAPPEPPDILDRDFTSPADLAPLPVDASGAPARFLCSATRDQLRQSAPERLLTRWCKLTWQPLPGLEAQVNFDRIDDTELQAAALRVMAELPPYLAAMGLQP